MTHLPTAASLIPWLDPAALITSAGPWAVLVVCLIIFSETGLLFGFFLPGDTLLLFAGIFAFHPGLGLNIWLVAALIAVAAFAGGEVGYLIGSKFGAKIFERKESGFFSKEYVDKTNSFFVKYGGLSVVLARFIGIVRTFIPVAAGVAKMDYRKYSLYNAIGAVIWSFGLVLLGYYLIPFTDWIGAPAIGEFVRDHIDLLLLIAIATAVIPAVVHLLITRAKTKRAAVDNETVASIKADIVAENSQISEPQSPEAQAQN